MSSRQRKGCKSSFFRRRMYMERRFPKTPMFAITAITPPSRTALDCNKRNSAKIKCHSNYRNTHSWGHFLNGSPLLCRLWKFVIHIVSALLPKVMRIWNALASGIHWLECHPWVEWLILDPPEAGLSSKWLIYHSWFRKLCLQIYHDLKFFHELFHNLNKLKVN